MKYQQGYFEMDFTLLFIFFGIGILATVIGVPFGLYWLFTHFAIVPV